MQVESTQALEREVARLCRKGQLLLGEPAPSNAAVLAMADEFAALIERLTHEKQRIADALLTYDRRMKAVTAYARH